MSLNPLLAIGVVVSTATTDSVYVLFNAAVSDRRRIRAASRSSIWYLLSAFAVISYTHNAVYVLLRRPVHGLAHSRCNMAYKRLSTNHAIADQSRNADEQIEPEPG